MSLNDVTDKVAMPQFWNIQKIDKINLRHAAMVFRLGITIILYGDIDI